MHRQYIRRGPIVNVPLLLVGIHIYRYNNKEAMFIVKYSPQRNEGGNVCC